MGLWLLAGCASDPGIVDLGPIPSRNRISAEPVETVLAVGTGTVWIGTADGRVLAADPHPFQVRASRQLAPGPIRALLPVGEDIVVAEQSPTGTVRRLRGSDLADLARLDLSDRLGQGDLPAMDDAYGIYQLPAAYGLARADADTLWVTGSRGWAEAGERRRRATVLRVRTSDLSIVGAWPAEGAVEAALHGAVPGPDGVLVAVRGAAETGWSDGVLQFDATLAPASRPIAPLSPWFKDVFVWDALAWAPAGPAAGSADGRVTWWRPEALSVGLASPVLAGDVPLVAGVVALAPWGDGLVATTGPTGVPWGTAAGVATPPDAHDGADTVWRIGPDATVRWAWFADAPIAAVLPDGDALDVAVSGVAGRRGVARLDATGAVLGFVAFEGFAGPLARTDGALFAVERPDPDGPGAWRVHRLAGTGAAPVWPDPPLTVGPHGSPGRPVDAAGDVAVGPGPWVLRGLRPRVGPLQVDGRDVGVAPGARFTVAIDAPLSSVTTAEGTRSVRLHVGDDAAAVELVDVIWPADAAGRRDYAVQADAIAVPPAWWVGRRPSDDPDVPWTRVGVRLLNRGSVDQAVVVRLALRDLDGRTAPGLRARHRGEETDASEVRVVVPARGEVSAVVPVFVQVDALRAGTYVRRVEWLLPGVPAPVGLREDRIEVRTASALPLVGLALGGAASVAGWFGIATWLPRRIRAFRRTDVVLIGLVAALGLVHGGGALALGMGLASVLGPFAPFVSGVADDAVRTVLVAALLAWVPRPGAAALWLCLGALLRALALGSVHPVEALYLGASVLWTEAALWALGVSRPTFPVRPFGDRWIRLGLALALPGMALSALSLSVSATLYRMDLHPVYVVALIAGPGGLYAAAAAGLGLAVADRLRRLSPG